MNESPDLSEKEATNQSISLFRIFPTVVAQFSLGRDLEKKELGFISDLNTIKNVGNRYSENIFLLNDKSMASLRQFIEDSLEEYFKTVHDPLYNTQIYITQSWANFNDFGDFHHLHSHSNSFISGVFYVNASKESDKIYFYREEYSQLKITPAKWNEYNAEHCWFPVETGDLILFPSSLKHMVQSNEECKTRISISFNTFLRGQLGQDCDLTTLNLR